MKLNLLSKPLFALLMLFLFSISNSCKKDNAIKQTALITQAKDYFEKNVLHAPAEVTTQAVGSVKSKRQLIGKEVLWKEAMVKQISLGEAVIVPLHYNSSLYLQAGKDKQSLALDNMSYLMMYKNREGTMQTEVVTWIPDNDYLDQVTKGKKNYSGIVLVEDWQGNFVKGYRYSKDGKSKLLSLPGEPKNGNHVSDLMEDCITNDWYSCGSVDGGESWYCHYDYTENTCYYTTTSGGSGTGIGSGTGPDDYPPGGGSSNGPDNGGSPCGGNSKGAMTVFVKPVAGPCDDPVPTNPTPDLVSDIKDSLSNPCLESTLIKMQSHNLSYELNNAICNTFSVNDRVNVIFKETSSLANSVLGKENILLDNTINNVRYFNAAISLNSNVLPNSSQEYIASTMMHEVLYAYFDYNQNLYDNSLGQHLLMAINYVDDLRVSLKNIFPYLSDQNANALIINGFSEIQAKQPANFNQILSHYNLSLSQIGTIRDNYKNGISGTTCP